MNSGRFFISRSICSLILQLSRTLFAPSCKTERQRRLRRQLTCYLVFICLILVCIVEFIFIYLSTVIYSAVDLPNMYFLLRSDQARRKQFDIGPANPFSSLSFRFLPSYFLPLLSPSVILRPLFFLPLSTLPLLFMIHPHYYPCSLPLPFLSPFLSFPSSLPPLRNSRLKYSYGVWERCKLPQREIKFGAF